MFSHGQPEREGYYLEAVVPWQMVIGLSNVWN